MNGQILQGGAGAWSVTHGVAYLYATRIVDGVATGPLRLYAVIPEGGAFADIQPVDTSSGRWACLVKYARDASLVPAVLEQDKTDRFPAFVARIEASLANDRHIQHQTEYSSHVVEEAVKRLSQVDEHLMQWDLGEIEDKDPLIESVRQLFAYLRIELRLPAVDESIGRKTLLHEILYLSNVQYKAVSLSDNWWKRDGVAMIGNLTDGTPVALLPHRVHGYRMFDPRTGETVRVTASVAKSIEHTATAVFRSLPEGKVGIGGVLRFLLGERVNREIIIALLCSFAAAVLQVIPPIVSAQIFDVFVPERLRGLLVEAVMILVAFAVADIGFSIIMNLSITRIYNKLSISFQSAVWDRLVSLPLAFFRKYTTGALLQKIRSTDDIKNILTLDNIQTFLAALFSFVNVIVLFRFSSTITPYVLLLFVVAAVVYFFAGKHKAHLKRRCQEVDTAAASLNQQLVDGAQRVQASAAQERVFGIWSAYEAQSLRLNSRIKAVDNGLAAFETFFQIGSTAAVYLLVFYLSGMEMGSFVGYVATFLILQKAFLKLLNVLCKLPDLLVAVDDIKPILETLPEHNSSKTVPKDMKGTLEVNQLMFRYGEFGRTILHSVSFRVEAGQSIGIVGPSGCGKSTLLKLLLGFYPPTGGNIYFGGYDLSTLDVRYLRRDLGVVMQDSELSVGDIRGVIMDNHIHLTEEKVWEALEMVGLKERVQALPKGLHTGMHNSPLSDGEKQRLLIARAVAKESPILLLDEPTSHLDGETQAMVMENLRRLRATKVIIAQRLSTVRHCDLILSLEQGTVKYLTQRKRENTANAGNRAKSPHAQPSR